MKNNVRDKIADLDTEESRNSCSSSDRYKLTNEVPHTLKYSKGTSKRPNVKAVLSDLFSKNRRKQSRLNLAANNDNDEESESLLESRQNSEDEVIIQISRISRETLHKANHVAMQLKADTERLQGTNALANEFDCSVTESRSRLATIHKNQKKQKLRLILVITILGILDILVLYIKLFK